MRGPDRSHALRLLIPWAVLSVIGVFIAMQVHLPPGDQSTQSVDETSLLDLMLIISTPVFIGVVLFILYSAFAFRQTRGATLEDGPPSYGNFRLQVVWVAITAVIVLVLAVIGINGLTSSAAESNFASSQAALGTAGSATASGKRLQVAGHRPAVVVHVPIPGFRWSRVAAPDAASRHKHRVPRDLD